MNWIEDLFRPKITVVRPEQMTEKELDAALGGALDSHPVYRAFMQLIDQAEESAHENADADIAVPRALECHTGGAKYLKALRNDVLARRERLRKATNRRG